ncbi:hypothetical protein Bca4012_084163 [Brassica carinata]
MAGPSMAPDLADFPPLGGKDSTSKPVKEEGKDFVEVPDGVIENMVPLWEDLIEGKFMDTAPHVAKIHTIVNKIWPLGNQSIRIEVFEVDSTTWSPEEEEEEVEIKTIPMWVNIKNVPRRMFSWKGLGFIASAVGKPRRLHPDTILCKSFEEAKVFVEVDVTKELPKSHHFKSKLGIEADVTFEYPWLPPKCNICTKWGHSGKACGDKKIRLLKKKDGTKEAASDGTQPELPVISTIGAPSALAVIHEVDEETNSVGEGKQVEVVSENEVERVVENVTEKEVEEVENKDGTNEKNEVGNEGRKVAETFLMELPITEGENWSNVSPSKQGRSTLKGTKEDSITSTPSRFAVLEYEQEESGTITHDAEEDSEEGEILENKSCGDADKHTNAEKSKQEIGDDLKARRVTRNSKSVTRNVSETKAQSTSTTAKVAIDLRVSDLLTNDLEWNKKMNEEILHNLSSQIQCLKPSMRGSEDIYILQPIQSDIYSTKSCYFTVYENPSINSQQSEQDFNSIRDVWSGSFSPKMKVFLWSIIQKALLLGDNLQGRGTISDLGCPRCNEPESLMHTFFSCPFTVKVWDKVPFLRAVHTAAKMTYSRC